MHLFMPLLITVAKIAPVAYYPSKDVATIVSRSISRFELICHDVTVFEVIAYCSGYSTVVTAP